MKKLDYLNRIFLSLVLLTILSARIPVTTKIERPEGPMKTWSKQDFNAYWSAWDNQRRLSKILNHEERKFGLHDGNKIRTLFYNYGSIGRPNTEPSLEWPAFSNNGYAYEFGVMVGAQVVDIDGDTIEIFSDGMLDGGDSDPMGGSNWWGWEPLPGYAADGQEYIAISSAEDTWGDLFPTDDDGLTQWPGQYGAGTVIADFESYYVMDDRWNWEFQYYPFINDSTRRGLGVEVEARGYQYAASVAEDIIFFLYKVTNVSDKRLENVVLGMIGDPHIGGAGDFADDYAGFIDNDRWDDYAQEYQEVSGMVYCWDKAGTSNDYGVDWSELGWLGYKFLESPSLSNDGEDNDKDGIEDESQLDGEDNDGDWDLTDELAAADTAEARNYYDPVMWDGIDNDNDGRIDDWGDLDGKSDDLNGNGTPDVGEPDFEELDVDESDMIGLTSFWAPIYETEEANEDDMMWLRMTPGTYATGTAIEQDADNVFIFGSGYFSLNPGESQKFSIAVIMGQGKEDMLENAKVADWIYRLNFQFTKPPDKPIVVAVPGDRRVTLHWDDTAEKSVDPVAGQDFEGYKIYRSLVKGEWGKPITNNQGIGIGYKPIAQFDYIDEISGPHPIPSAEGYHMDMGDETGLVRTFTDTNLVNGLTYYYAVTAYDQGSISGNLTPLECAKNIGDVNVITATPNAPVSGYESASFEVDHYEGFGMGTFAVNLIDPISADPNTVYDISITKSGNNKLINILEIVNTDSTSIWENISLSTLANTWRQNLVTGPYEFNILDLSSMTLDSVTWEPDLEPYFHSIIAFPGGVAYPRDLEIRFFEDYADTTILVGPQPVKFQVWNINDNEQLDIILFDDGNNELSAGDRIVPVVYVNSAPTGTWEITIDSVNTAESPVGTVLKFWVNKPFVSWDAPDRYRVSFTPATVNQNLVADAMDRIAVVPNPYVASSNFETPPPQVFTYGRGERRVDFIHLPQVCTIRIFTLVGEHVETIEHAGTLYDGTESWNLLSKDGHDIAPGIYIYHVETPDGEEKLGRLAVIK